MYRHGLRGHLLSSNESGWHENLQDFQLTNASDQVGRIYIGREGRRNGHIAMFEQDAVLIFCEADLVAHVLDVQGRQLSVKELLNTGHGCQCNARWHLDRPGIPERSS